MIEVNREGKLTRGQKIYLLRQFLERLGFILLWLLSIFFVENALRYGVGGITTFYWLLLTGFKSLGIMALIGYTGRCTNCSMQDGQNRSCRMSSCLQNEVIAAKSYFLLSQSERIFLFVD